MYLAASIKNNFERVRFIIHKKFYKANFQKSVSR